MPPLGRGPRSWPWSAWWSIWRVHLVGPELLEHELVIYEMLWELLVQLGCLRFFRQQKGAHLGWLSFGCLGFVHPERLGSLGG